MIPTNSVLGPTFARFRLSTTDDLLPTGAAADGEVEDYMVTLCQYLPLTNIAITNIVATNIVLGGVTSQVVVIKWRPEAGVHYRAQVTSALNASPPTWNDTGPEVIGPACTYCWTNAVTTDRFYPVVAPYTCP